MSGTGMDPSMKENLFFAPRACCIDRNRNRNRNELDPVRRGVTVIAMNSARKRKKLRENARKREKTQQRDTVMDRN